MGSRRMLACSVATVALAGCAALAGFEDEYSVGGVGTGSANTATGGGGTATGTAATPTGAGGTSTGTTTTGTGTAGAGGGSQTGIGGSSPGGSSPGGSGQGGTEPPTWHVINEFDVPIDGTPVESGVILQLGVDYRLRASGYFDCMNNGSECDAEYVGRGTGPDDMAGGYDFGIGIDVSQFAASVQPYWGNFNPSHIYEVPWTGDGTTISAKLFDPVYDNNVGSDLHIQILQLL